MDTPVLVFEVVTPGTWLESEDRDWSWQTEGLLRSLTSQFYDANLALNLFMSARASRPRVHHKETWEHDASRRSEIQRQIEQERGAHLSHEGWEEIRFETEVRLKREKWESRVPPREFEHSLPFLYARAFLYAVDVFEKTLSILANDPKVPSKVADIHARMLTQFPNLRGVRNSVQHIEDRSRGLGAGRNPQPLDLKPINNHLISAPNGGALILNSLNGTRYGSTMADGHFGEVDVSLDSMRHIQGLLSETLEAFKWKGPRHHGPSA